MSGPRPTASGRRTRRRHALACGAAVILHGSVLLAAGDVAMVVHIIEPVGQGNGYALSSVPDVDGDGVADIVAGSPLEDDPFVNAGAARLYSGRTAELLLAVAGSAPGESFGAAVASPGDLDGDAVPDLVVGAPRASGRAHHQGRVAILSGADGGLIREIIGQEAEGQLGWSVAWIRDLDGDGVADLALGAPFAGAGGRDAGRVTVVSGATGDTLHDVIGRNPGERLGDSIVALDDFDGDGLDDYAVGAPGAIAPGSTSPGCVRIHSGADGGLLTEICGPPPHGPGIHRVVDRCDWDADGRTDLVVTAGFTAAVCSGADGSVLFSTHGSVWPPFVQDARIVGDVTRDGVPELVVGSWSPWGEKSGIAELVSGATGEQLSWTKPLQSYSVISFGGSLAVLGDLDGDGYVEFAAAGGQDFVGGVDIMVASTAPSPWEHVAAFGPFPSSGKGVMLPLSNLQGGQDVKIRLAKAQPGLPAVLVAGFAPSFQPLMGGTLVPSADIVLPVGSIDASGDAVISGRWPNDVPSGTTLWVQWWMQDPIAPFGWGNSNAAKGTSP